MRRVFQICGLLAAILWTGCVSERIVWSPDGTRAVVLGDDGMHVCDISGKISSVLVVDVKCAEWMPDSQRVIVSKQKSFKKWPDASHALPEEVETAQKNVDAVREELLAARDWTTFFKNTKNKLNLTNEQLVLALMNLRDGSAGSLVLKMDKNGQKIYSELAILEDTLQIFQLDKAGAKAGPILYQHKTSGEGIQSLRVSPTGRGVLVTLSDNNRDKDQQNPLELLLVPTDGSKKVIDLGKSSRYPDWSPDEKYAVVIMPDWNGVSMQEVVADLVRFQVTDENGNFVTPTGGEPIAGMVFNENQRVRMAKDGRIFFSAAEISLPAAARDFETRPTIFSFEPDKQSTLTRVVPRSAAQTMGDAAQYFELSPDAKYLSIPFADGRVSIINIASLASDEVQIVQPDAKNDGDNKSELATVPVWRTATELTFIRPVANSTKQEMVRYSVPDRTATVISSDWPAGVGLGGKASNNTNLATKK